MVGGFFCVVTQKITFHRHPPFSSLTNSRDALPAQSHISAPGHIYNWDYSVGFLPPSTLLQRGTGHCPNYLKELLAVTYAIELKGEIIAMFSLCNDRLDVHDFDDDRKKFKKAAKEIPHTKRGMKHYPAVKIARLAVRKGIESKGLGRSIVVFLQVFFILHNKTGCRFLTVDAYPASVGFYEKVGFKQVAKAPSPNPGNLVVAANESEPMSEEDMEDDPNVLMYLDLGVMADSPQVQTLKPIVEGLLTDNRAEFEIAPPTPPAQEAATAIG